MKKIAIALMTSGFAAAALAAPPAADFAPANDMAPATTTTAPAKKAPAKKVLPKKKVTHGKATAPDATKGGTDTMAAPADTPASSAISH